MISIVSHYYDNDAMVARFLNSCAALQRAEPGKFEIVLVDDHSHKPFRDFPREVTDLRVYRVDKDISWNQGGARNIGVLESRRNIVLLTDIDHVVKQSDSAKVLARARDIKLGTRLQFARELAKPDGTIEPVKPHVNSFMMHRTDFWKVGGYDELFSGSYGHEDIYLHWCLQRAGFAFDECDARLTVSQVGSTTGLSRDTARNSALLAYFKALHQVRAQTRFLSSYELIHEQ